MNLDSNNVIERLLEIIPEVHPLYDKLLERWEDEEKPGLHIIFGDILTPYIIDLLEQDNKSERLKRIFDFLEEMAVSNDNYVKEVLAFSVLEHLGDNPIILKKAKMYMGYETKKSSDEVEEFWGRKQKE